MFVCPSRPLANGAGIQAARPALIAAAAGAGVLTATALWWRKHPSACPYGQRFWVEVPHPLITRSRMREALAPRPGENVLEVGPGTGYYTLELARGLAPDGTLPGARSSATTSSPPR
jgi:hypothetical protein